MEIVSKKVAELKPDKNQPRKKINPEDVEKLALSYKIHGIINPIEIDKNNVIITGEMRWWAAKKADLKEIPCKVLELDENTRFLRQLTENIHHYDVDQWDLAVALKKALAKFPTSLRVRGYDKGYKWLADQIGCTQPFIQEHIEILDPEIVSPAVQEGMKTGEIPYSMIRAIKKSKAIEKDLLKGKMSREKAYEKATFQQLNLQQRMLLELKNITISGLIWNKERAKKLCEETNEKQKAQIKKSIQSIIEKWSEILQTIK